VAKKRTFGVSPKGALILREREEQRRRNLPRVAVKPDGGVYIPRNPLLEIMREYPMITHALPPEALAAVNPELLELVTKQIMDQPLWVGAQPFQVVVANSPVSLEGLTSAMTFAALGLDTPPPLVTHTVVETDTTDSLAAKFLESWGGLPFLTKSQVEEPARRYKLRKANARAEVGPADNNYRDFHDTIRSWYSRDAEPREYRLYTSEVKMCDNLEKLTKYFGDFKERSGGTRLSGLEVTIGWEADDLFKLLVTEVFYHEQVMLLLEVVTTAPNMRPMGFIRYFKDPGTLKARNDTERDISWSFNVFFSDQFVFGRDQLNQFLDIVVYCLDKGVREEISYYG
jgi:hypothetical protein